MPTSGVKLTNQLVVVIVTGIIGIVGLIVGLAVLADWSDGAIIGLATAFGAILINSVVAVRNQNRVTATLVEQDVKLDTITAQTNGLSEIERQEIAERAAAAVVRQFRGEL